MNKKVPIIAAFICLLDQISKILVSNYLVNNVTIIKNFFYLTLVYNKGAAWGILENHTYIITIIMILALIFLVRIISNFKNNLRNNIAFGLVIGGLLGNLIDRIFRGYVIDFLDFYIFKYDYPVFNISDIAIVIGMFLLVFAIIKGEDTHEDNSKRKSR